MISKKTANPRSSEEKESPKVKFLKEVLAWGGKIYGACRAVDACLCWLKGNWTTVRAALKSLADLF